VIECIVRLGIVPSIPDNHPSAGLLRTGGDCRALYTIQFSPSYTQAMTDSIQQFVDSYARVGARDLESGGFLDSFYQRFVGSSPSIAEKFKDTDMDQQREMLRVSLDHMVYFAIDKEETDEISRVASAHASSRADVPAHLYEMWLDSLVATVREFDPLFNAEIEAAWRAALAPSIDYMQRHYDAG